MSNPNEFKGYDNWKLQAPPFDEDETEEDETSPFTRLNRILRRPLDDMPEQYEAPQAWAEGGE